MPYQIKWKYDIGDFVKVKEPEDCAVFLQRFRLTADKAYQVVDQVVIGDGNPGVRIRCDDNLTRILAEWEFDLV